jgi:hypothetical protein
MIQIHKEQEGQPSHDSAPLTILINKNKTALKCMENMSWPKAEDGALIIMTTKDISTAVTLSFMQLNLKS